MKPFAVPETAIGMFEQVHGLRVTVHDLRGSLWPYLHADRFQHGQAICQAVKMAGGHDECVNFEVKRLRRELPVLQEGRMHMCHAGLVEWVVPVFQASSLAWVLFAGLRRPGKTLRCSHIEPARKYASVTLDGLAEVEAAEADVILEHLRQLAARLECWAARAAAPVGSNRDAFGNDPIARRKLIIHRFVQAHHQRDPLLEELAAELNMSASRASHVVHETCGSSFRDLLTEARLNTAKGLLRATDLSVLEISLRSGFREVAHFYRTFRNRVGVTPRRYRVENQT